VREKEKFGQRPIERENTAPKEKRRLPKKRKGKGQKGKGQSDEDALGEGGKKEALHADYSPVKRREEKPSDHKKEGGKRQSKKKRIKGLEKGKEEGGRGC